MRWQRESGSGTHQKWDVGCGRRERKVGNIGRKKEKVMFGFSLLCFVFLCGNER